ncbi:MAG: hypothetical protein R3E52_13055 [Burkholderiaceae bacterium]
MHAAPAVTHPTGRTPQLAALLLGLWALGAAGAAGSLALRPNEAVPGWQWVVLLAAPLLVGAALACWWRAQRPRRLAWDGAQWRLLPGAAGEVDWPIVRLQVRLDLQWALLLRVDGPGWSLGRWLWAQAGADAAGWHLLRCAVHAGAPAGVGAADTGEGVRV